MTDKKLPDEEQLDVAEGEPQEPLSESNGDTDREALEEAVTDVDEAPEQLSSEAAAEADGEPGEDPDAAPAVAAEPEPAAPPSAAAPTAVSATSPTPPPTPQPAAAPPPEPAPARSNAAPIAWAALAVALVVAFAGFNKITDLQGREALLMQRIQGLEAVSGQDDTTFEQMRDNLQRQIELELEGMTARQQRLVEDQERAVGRLETLATESSDQTRRALTGELSSLTNDLSSLNNRLDSLRNDLTNELREQEARFGDLSVEDRQSWQLAEAQYLLRLANQRLIMTGDTVSAEALLRSADNILQDLDNPDLFDLRAAVTSDLAAVRAVPKLDVQGLYLRLDALIRQTDALVLFELPVRSEPEVTVDAEDWQARLSQGYELALAKLSEYIVVSRRDVPVETLMDPQYEGLVRQNMRMLLEQAQVAMLSGNALLFRQSLERAEGWVTQFFKADEQSAVAMAEELRLIRDEQITVTLPDLNDSLRALNEVMSQRLSRNGN